MRILNISTKYKIREGLAPTSFVSIPLYAEGTLEKGIEYINSFLGKNLKELTITIQENEYDRI